MGNVTRAGLAGLGGALAALALAVPAQASTTANFACAMTGAATAEVLWVGGAPSAYTVNGLVFACAGAYSTTDYPPNPGGAPASGGPAVATVDATSTGIFTNIVCGTATATDPDPAHVATAVLDPGGDAKAILDETDFGYAIVFVGGHGALVWTGTGARWRPTGGGYVNITPDDSFPVQPPPNGVCTHGFTLAGVVGLNIAGV